MKGDIRTIMIQGGHNLKVGAENDQYKILDVKFEKNDHFSWCELTFIEK